MSIAALTSSTTACKANASECMRHWHSVSCINLITACDESRGESVNIV